MDDFDFVSKHAPKPLPAPAPSPFRAGGAVQKLFGELKRRIFDGRDGQHEAALALAQAAAGPKVDPKVPSGRVWLVPVATRDVEAAACNVAAQVEKFVMGCRDVTTSMAHVAAGLEVMAGSQLVDPSPQQSACVPLAMLIAFRDIAADNPELNRAAEIAKAFIAEADGLRDNGMYDNGRELKIEMLRAFHAALAWVDKKGAAFAAGDAAKQQLLQRLAGASRRGARALAAWKQRGSAAGAEGYLEPDAALVGVQLLLGLRDLPLSLVVLAEVVSAAQGACRGAAAAAPGIAVHVVPAPGVVQTALDAAVENGEPYELPPATTVTIIMVGGHARAVVLRRHLEVWYHGSDAGVSAYEGGRLVPVGMERHQPAGTGVPNWKAVSRKHDHSPCALSRVPSGMELNAGAASPPKPLTSMLQSPVLSANLHAALYSSRGYAGRSTEYTPLPIHFMKPPDRSPARRPLEDEPPLSDHHVPARQLNNAAVRLCRSGDVSTAMSMLQQAVKAMGRAAQDGGLASREAVNRGRQLEASGDFQGAEGVYKDVLSRDPTYIDCYLRLACMATARGRHEDAWQYMRTLDALQDDLFRGPTDVCYGTRYAHIYLHTSPKDRREDSVKEADARCSKELCEYRQVLDADPRNVGAANGCGALAELSDLDAAQSIFSEVYGAMALSDSFLVIPDNLINLANCQLSRKNYADAVQLYRAALDRLEHKHHPLQQAGGGTFVPQAGHPPGAHGLQAQVQLGVHNAGVGCAHVPKGAPPGGPHQAGGIHAGRRAAQGGPPPLRATPVDGPRALGAGWHQDGRTRPVLRGAAREGYAGERESGEELTEHDTGVDTATPDLLDAAEKEDAEVRQRRHEQLMREAAEAERRAEELRRQAEEEEARKRRDAMPRAAQEKLEARKSDWRERAALMAKNGVDEAGKRISGAGHMRKKGSDGGAEGGQKRRKGKSGPGRSRDGEESDEEEAGPGTEETEQPGVRERPSEEAEEEAVAAGLEDGEDEEAGTGGRQRKRSRLRRAAAGGGGEAGEGLEDQEDGEQAGGGGPLVGGGADNLADEGNAEGGAAPGTAAKRGRRGAALEGDEE